MADVEHTVLEFDPLEVLVVDVGDLRPNPWNPNQQTPRVSAAVQESIERFGFIDPVLVRPHPDGGYEIVDGEHRWDAAKDAGHDQVAVIVRDLTDDEAKKLTIILNETRGTADVIGLATLLDDLSKSLSPEELILGLPYQPDELSDLIQMAELDWGTKPEGERAGGGEPGESAGWETINCRVPADVKAAAVAAFEHYWADKEAPDAEDVAWGLLLGHLAGAYLAGVD